MILEEEVKRKLRLRGFTEKQLLNNRGLIAATIEDVILVQNLTIPVVMDWVACKDRLPTKECSYIVNWDGIILEAQFYCKEQMWGDYEVSIYKNVTHWMELPKPPCA